MTERVCLIEASELAVIRVTCGECGLTTELALAKAQKALSNTGACKHCNADLLDMSVRNPLHGLMLALDALSGSKKLRVEFSLGQPQKNPRHD